MSIRMRGMRRWLIGKPLPSSRAKHERLSKIVALPVFSSDALSSVAYGTEEILLALALGALSFSYSLYIGVAIAVLLVVLTFSYRQTIASYPTGGGAYIVVSDNLGLKAGTAAGAALLIDYVLTVAVSIASGVAAIDSAYPVLAPWRPEICVLCVLAVAGINLRGVRESGALFSIPTYAFVASFLFMIGKGLWMWATHTATPLPLPEGAHLPTGTLGTLGTLLFIKVILQAFASGCSALTGVEAISDGVPAFRPPEAKNAASTMIYMAVLLGAMFLGITFLARVFGVVPGGGETAASQIARAVFGRGPAYYVIQAATALILILAANTSFADFPRLSFFLARDRLMPGQFSHVGDRLVYSNGIITLAALASVLIVVFRGDVHRLIPLYAVGVFLSFTLSQSGMVMRWRRKGVPWWGKNILVNGAGAIVTFVALCVIASMKFIHGAWVVVILIPMLMYVFFRIHAHYQNLRKQLTVEGWERPKASHHTVLVLVGGMHRDVVRALDYTRLISADCRALYVETEPEHVRQLHDQWEKWSSGVPLIMLGEPYRSQGDPVLQYLDATQAGDSNHVVSVILPESLRGKGWQYLLRYRSEWARRLALTFRRNVIVTSVPYHVENANGSAEEMSLDGWERKPGSQHTVLILVSGIHRGVVHAMDFARLIAADCRALYVEIEPQNTVQFHQRWEKWAPDVPLIILDSPYRSIREPVLDYVDAVQDGDPSHMVTIILPEFVPAKWWHHLLHNQSAWFLKWALLWRQNVIVTNVRYYLGE